ncbi:MAG: type II secretion system protein [Bacteroidota bacterium]
MKTFWNRIKAHLAADEGFSMTELMVVLVIVGILALLALPRFMNVATKAKTSEAKMQLRNIHSLQTAHYFEYDVYASDLVTLQYEATPTVSDGGTARYEYTVEAAEGAQFMVIATAVVDFDKDQVFNVWEVDQTGRIRERTPD